MARPRPGDEDDMDPTEVFEDEAMARYALDRVTQTAADLVMELNNKGARGLAHYAAQARDNAIEALLKLIEHDPTDHTGVAALQAQAKPYIDLCEFVHRTLEQGESADRAIEENFGNDETYPD